MRIRIGKEVVRFKKKQSPRIVTKLSTLSWRRREEGFRNWEEFQKFIKGD